MFIPIVFMGGIVGRLLHEFAVTIIMAILFSGVISITLTPMLCARILKDEHGQKHDSFYRMERKQPSTRCRASMTAPCAGASPMAASSWACSSPAWPASVLMMMIMQQDFLPSDDTGRLQGIIQAANGTSYARWRPIRSRS